MRSEPPRVGLYCEGESVGGAERSLLNLVTAYRGHAELVLCSPGDAFLAECAALVPQTRSHRVSSRRSRVGAVLDHRSAFQALELDLLQIAMIGERGREVRDYLRRCDGALTGLGELIIGFAERAGLDTAPYRAFVDVLERDARDASAAIRLVLAQPAIGSQLVDNLNASIHLRALLTDLFLIDEVLKLHKHDGPD